MNHIEAIKERFQTAFESSREALTAMGDSNRQLIMRTLIEHCGTKGLRVGEIQKNANISRAAVSHHLKVLREAGVVNIRREGTKNYYYLDSQSTSLRNVIELWKIAEEMMSFCPHNRKKE